MAEAAGACTRSRIAACSSGARPPLEKVASLAPRRDSDTSTLVKPKTGVGDALGNAAVTEALGLQLLLTEADAVLVPLALPLLLPLVEAIGLVEGDALPLLLVSRKVALLVPDAEADLLAEPLVDGEDASNGEGDGEGVCENDTNAESVREGECVGLAVLEGDTLRLADAEPLADIDALAAADDESDGVVDID